jgi:hypothetical protein
MAVANGAELVRELLRGGTGERKIAVARKVLSDVWAREHRVATAAEVVEALEESEAVGEVTIAKARELAGLPSAREVRAAKSLPIEALLLGETAEFPLDAGAPAAGAGTSQVEKPAAPAPPPEGDEPKAPATEFLGPKKVIRPEGKK